MKKIIHIASDEKFINSAYWQFNEIFPKQNVFYLLIDDDNKKLKHVQLNEDFILIKKNLNLLRSLASEFNHNEVVIFHGLDYHKSFLMDNLSEKCTKFWILWGAEFYNNPYLNEQKELYGTSTSSNFFLKSGKERFINFIKDSTRQFYYKVKNRTDKPHKLIFKAIKKADYFGILYREEFDFIQESTNTDLQFLQFSYYPIELMVKDTDARIKADNIVIGNSASMSNNHLEAFELLSNLPVKGKQIVVPLSYGSPEYAKAIIKKGKEIFCEDFKPLVEFMPLHEYNQYLEQCGIVIMNHYRQQAVGNVLTMLWMGAKVYLDERNTLYHYLKRIGIYVFSIQKDLRNENPKVFLLLEKRFQDANRNILRMEIGQKALLSKLETQLKIIVA